MLTTPFHDREAPMCFASGGGPAQWNGWDPYIIPDRYFDYDVEYRAVRESAGAIDMSALWKVEVSGPDAERYLNYLLPRDVAKMPRGKVIWTPLCSERGKVVGDGPLMRMSDDTFWFSSYPMETWFRRQLGDFDVDIKPFTDEYGILSLQGPNSMEVLNAATAMDWSDLGFMRAREAEIGGATVTVMRVGFTGELGYELWVPRQGAISMWDALFDAGAQFGLRAVGHSINHVVRVEAGLLVPAIDYTADTTFEEEDFQHMRGAGGEPSSPQELGMRHAVELSKNGDFVGKAALLAEQENGAAHRRQVGIEINPLDVVALYLEHGRCPVVDCQVRIFAPPLRVESEPEAAGREPVGRASSVVWSPARKSLIGLASLDAEASVSGTSVWVRWPVVEGTDGAVSARVVDLPFTRDRRQT